MLARLAVAAVLGWLLVASGEGAPSTARGMDPQQAIEAGQRALAQRKEYPWYDRQRDALRRIRVDPPRDSAAHRGSTWQAQPTARDYTWLETLLGWLWRILRWLFWIGLVAVWVGLIILLARAFAAREIAGTQPGDATDAGAAGAESDRIDDLPFQVRLPQADLLSEARRQYEQGNYGQAIVYLFSYKLIALDRHGLIRVSRGKTNRQYLAELPPQPPLRQMLQRTMEAFEDVFFGKHPLDRDRFESCWRQLDEFHRHLQQSSVS